MFLKHLIPEINEFSAQRMNYPRKQATGLNHSTHRAGGMLVVC